ncbi:pyruvate kinase [Halococcus hamelinensis]|uniref:Pyruvate kinase n=1 Tax=Halococcus hamelinensis 100A6 TaxID=1132509 RepID=M0M5X3_9EURY|nr:pyruvate kinase [Halococcus hamelinensis]EMA41217.1 pyruvate kinase [Halococcus hamelinensis 100A6]
MNNTKIVCTLGPSSGSRETIEALVEAGMSVARFNASHGSTDERADLIDRVKSVDEATEDSVATMLDLSGPEVRTAPLDADLDLPAGTVVEFVEGAETSAERVGLSESITAVEPGDTVLLDDGRIETTVEGVDGEVVRAHVDSGGSMRGRMGVNVPGVDLGFDVLTEADERELDLAAEAEVDFVAMSFVREAADVYTVNEALEARDADIPVVAKIERADAVDNLQGIVEAAYGVMVARGDLGVECALEEVPLIQKRIIRECLDEGTPVITATEMLDTMTHSRRPTRAEASDVANAVLDGTDAVMLSGETAVGDHPVRVVEAMSGIVREVERSPEYDDHVEQAVPKPDDSRTGVLARSARYLARDTDATAVVAATESGYTALKTAKYRPEVPIVAVTPDDRVRRRLCLSAGVLPRYAPLTGEGEGTDNVIRNAVRTTLAAGVAESGDTVVVLAGLMTDLEGANTTNMLKLHVAAEVLASGRSVVTGRVAGPLHHAPDGDLTTVPEGAVLFVSQTFDGEFAGDPRKLGGVVSAHQGVTGYAAIVARETGLPMISNVSLPDSLADGDEVTLDAGRGVVYEGRVGN